MMTSAAKHSAPRLSELLTAFASVDKTMDREVSAVCMDSRQVEPGAVFFARRGLTHDATQFVDDAVRAGAVAVVREGKPGAVMSEAGVVQIQVPEIDACAGEAAHRFYGRPSEAMRVVGVTGTNGKTSVSHFIAHGLDADAGSNSAPAGIIGTLGYGTIGALDPGILTTPDAIHLHRLLADIRAGGAGHTVMEVSSHALSQGRVAGVRFDTAVFTNLSRDHLDFHGDMASYGAAKARLFMSRGLRHAVVNLDDEFGRALMRSMPENISVSAYTMAPEQSLNGSRKIESLVCGRLAGADQSGLNIAVEASQGWGTLSVSLLGRFNAQNLLAALCVLLEQGVEFERALESLRGVPTVPGRMQRFGSGAGEPLVVVDYAHTPGALEAALRALRDHCGGRLWCVFGCGGDRDEGKRPQMGAVADTLADLMVITDDNPRNEDGDVIVEGILKGFENSDTQSGRLIVQRDRSEAIRHAVLGAGADDIVLVAGKGHETYQEVKGVRRPFSDAAAVRSALEARRSC